MTYSQLLFRVAAAVIVSGGTYLLVSDQLCIPTKSAGCREVHGMAAVFLFLAALAFASLFLIASLQPRRGARMRFMILAGIAWIVFLVGAFLVELFAPG
jgi:hypothetical protein